MYIFVKYLCIQHTVIFRGIFQEESLYTLGSSMATFLTPEFGCVICNQSIWTICKINIHIYIRFYFRGLCWSFSCGFETTRGKQQINFQHFLKLMNFLKRVSYAWPFTGTYFPGLWPYILFKIIITPDWHLAVFYSVLLTWITFTSNSSLWTGKNYSVLEHFQLRYFVVPKIRSGE
jgi:hypothetical protein